jgi:hypothetical protein
LDNKLAFIGLVPFVSSLTDSLELRDRAPLGDKTDSSSRNET